MRNIKDLDYFRGKSDKGLYEIMCWLSTVLSETYSYNLDVVDSFQNDKIYLMNVSGWA